MSQRSTRNAVREVVGGKVTNYSVWDRHQDRTIENQPALWSGMTVVADYRARSARIAGSEVALQEELYMGGALIFLAAVESQAKHLGATVRKLSGDELSPWMQLAMAGSLTNEELASIDVAIYNTTPDEDLQKLGNAPLKDRRAVREQLIADNAASFESSPFIERTAELLERAATESFQAATIAIAGFLEAEPHFTSFMNDFWWDASPPPTTLSQQMGATDMRGLLQAAGVE